MANEQTSTKVTKTADPGVKLPEAVVRAAARAAELSEQQRTREGARDGRSNVQMSFADVNSPTPPIAPEGNNTPLANTSQNGQPAASPSGSSPPLSSPQPSSHSSQSPSKSYSESDMQAAVGRFQKAQQENANLSKRLGELQKLLATVAPPATVDPRAAGRGDTTFSSPATAPFVPKRYITPEEEKEWGADLINLARKAAKEVAEAEMAPMRGEFQQVRQSLGNVQTNIAQTAQDQIYEELTKEIPDWNDINNSQEFRHWANQPDPMSGLRRVDLLTNAFNNGQASRVIAAFKGYKAEQATSGPAQTGRSQPGNGAESLESGNATNSQSKPATTPAVDLASLAAPGRARGGQQGASPDKPLVTGAEIAQFYSDVTRGKYAGREKEYQLIEQQIQEALRDGRVRR